MSKTIGTILVIAAVAFAIAVPVFGLPALGLTAATAATITAALSAAIMVNGLLMPKGISSGDLKSRQASEVTLQIGETPRMALFGEAATAGSLVDAFNYGGTYGTDWEVLTIALADHYCEALTSFYVSDKLETFSGDGLVTGYNSQLAVYFRHGDAVQTLPSVVTTNGPGWAASDYGSGICYVVVAYKADAPTATDPVWPGGRPNFLWIVKGKRCYDPRHDSTVSGGSGTQRWATPSTWTWTNNPIVCRYNWARGVYAGDAVASPDKLLVGRGLSEVEQPPVNLFAPANLCDELVGGEKQFQIAGSVYANEKFIDVEERFASAVAGIVVTHEGAVEIEPAQAKAVSATFTDDDLLVGGQVQYNEDILSEADSDWVNTVIPRYVEPAQKWRDHSAPVRRDLADIAADNGPREQTVGMDMVIRAVQAGVTGEIHRRLGRLWGRGSVPLPPRFAELEEGDWVAWMSARRFGGATKTFRIEAFGMDEKWQSRHQLREIASSVFTSVPGLADLSNPYSPTTPPSLTAPTSGDWALTGVVISGVPALHLAGAVTMSAVSAVVFEHRVYASGLGDDDNWFSDGIEAPSITAKTISGVGSALQYQVSVRYQVSGELTARRILGPVTTDTSVLTQLIQSSYIAAGMTFKIDDTGHVYISDHTRIYADELSGVSVEGLSSDAGIPATRSGSVATAGVAGDFVYIYYDDAARAGGAVSYQFLKITAAAIAAGTGDATNAFASPSHPYRHTVISGFVPPIGGSTGGGSDVGSGGGTPNQACVTTDSVILMANAAGDGPGDEKRAGDVRPGELVWTRHETSFEWGAWPISAAVFVDAPVMARGGWPTATARHRFALPCWLMRLLPAPLRWFRMHLIGRPAGDARVAKLSVAVGRTYMARHPSPGSPWRWSHNLKMNDPSA